MKRLILILYLLILVLNINLNGAVIRNDVIYRASTYATYNWVVNTPNPRYWIYRKSGLHVTGVAYSRGGKESIYTFKNSVYAGIMPRNWEGNNSGHSYTGIDCSGLVQYCWGIGIEGIDPVVLKCVKINGPNLKSGDVVAKQGKDAHIQITANNTFGYESVGWSKTEDIYHQMVISSPLHSGYTPFSPFPQFSDEYPADGAVFDSSMKLDSISVMICGKGNFTTSNISMAINGQMENNTVVKIISDTSVLFVSYDSTFFDSLKGEINVEVTARANSI